METVYDGMPWMKDLITKADPILDALRWMGYGFLRVLAKIVDVLFNAIQGLLGINILQIQPVQNFVNSVTPLGWSVLVISLIGGFILLMLYPGRHKGEMARGLLMAVMLMISVPFMFQTLNDFKDAGVSDISSSMTAADKPGETILQASTYDVANSTGGVTNIYSNCDPYYLNINARIPKENSAFTKKIDAVYGDTMYGSDLGDGFFGWGEERLYAYNFNFVEPLFSLLIMLICLLFTGFKLGRLLFDLVTHQIIAPVVFASDISGAGRSKKFMQSLISNYIVMVLILVLLNIYMDLTTWTTTNLSDVWVRILLIAGASWGVIDGPDIILKLIGVDAGVRNGAAVMMGANAAVNLGHSAGGAISNVAHTVSKAPGNAAGAVGAVAGGISGIKSMAGNMEMGHGLGSNAQARSDAGIGGLGDMRGSMKSDEPGSPGTGGQTGGYTNVPKPSSMGERYSASKQNVSDGIGRTAATVGYAAGKASDAVGSAFRNATGRYSTAGTQTESGQPTPYPSHLPHNDYAASAPPDASVQDAPVSPSESSASGMDNEPPVSPAEPDTATETAASTDDSSYTPPVQEAAYAAASPISTSESGDPNDSASEPSPVSGSSSGSTVGAETNSFTDHINTPPSSSEPNAAIDSFAVSAGAAAASYNSSGSATGVDPTPFTNHVNTPPPFAEPNTTMDTMNSSAVRAETIPDTPSASYNVPGSVTGAEPTPFVDNEKYTPPSSPTKPAAQAMNSTVVNTNGFVSKAADYRPPEPTKKK